MAALPMAALRRNAALFCLLIVVGSGLPGAAQQLASPVSAPSVNSTPSPLPGETRLEPTQPIESIQSIQSGTTVSGTIVSGTVVSGTVVGTIVDRDGSFCEGAPVELEFSPSVAALSIAAPSGREVSPPRTALSDREGRFRFVDVPPGAFTLSVRSSGFVSNDIQGVLLPGQIYDAHSLVLQIRPTVSDISVSASQQEIAQAQVEAEEHQRIFGGIPNFYVVYSPNAPPLTARQKFGLAEKTAFDPITFLFIGGVAGIEQADDAFHGYGQGAQGYAKRYAAAFADNVSGTIIGNYILPTLLKQDPRYFYKGTGTVRARVLYALANAFICKGDNGRWQPAYSSILGGIAAGGLSNLYYPSANRTGWSLTFENAGIGIGFGAVQNLFQEFLVRKLTPNLPGAGNSNHP